VQHPTIKKKSTFEHDLLKKKPLPPTPTPTPTPTGRPRPGTSNIPWYLLHVMLCLSYTIARPLVFMQVDYVSVRVGVCQLCGGSGSHTVLEAARGGQEVQELLALLADCDDGAVSTGQGDLCGQEVSPQSAAAQAHLHV
jgi:hypothetical protein